MVAVVADVERIVCELPFTERQAQITEREVYTWNVVELCKVTLSTGEVGWGETVLSVRLCSALLVVQLQQKCIYCAHHRCLSDLVACCSAGTTHRLGR